MKKAVEMLLALMRRFRRLISFGLVGLVNTLVDYAVFTGCYELLKAS